MSKECVEISDFERIFVALKELPQSRKQKMLEDLCVTLDRSKLEVADLFYLPMMLAHESLELSERCTVDWAFFELNQPIEFTYKTEEKILFVPPDLKIIRLKFSYLERGLTEGVWLLRRVGEQVNQQELNVYEAQILDVLAEDRKFTSRQLLDFLMFAEGEGIDLAKFESFKEALRGMISKGFILEG